MRVNRATNASLVVVTHDPVIAAAMDRTVTLEDTSIRVG